MSLGTRTGFARVLHNDHWPMEDDMKTLRMMLETLLLDIRDRQIARPPSVHTTFAPLGLWPTACGSPPARPNERR